jgi:hypothetical protein
MPNEDVVPVTVYGVLAVASAFAADKILRSMFDKVLKKLEQKAEKTKDTEKT